MSSPLIDRLTDELGYPRVTIKTLDAVLHAADNAVLFFTADPANTPEANDVAVVLPELVKHFNGRITPAVVAREDERTLQAMYGFELWPALVFLRKNQYLGTISKIRDWTDYLEQIQGFLDAGPVRPPAPRIPIIPA
ncbi:hydrogenase-1 operon protein HyaE [mine drainage metagenome]|jgi:hydrogenase-1 operon protein HyaE|uniref:Hydrogenase expression/formation protein n=2 Tax=root TaxID=1 RepID=A0A238D159_THIDL|nr:hydrogenase-1 expression HyaE [Thiomonas delicata]MDE2130716.1 hydrogenase-1 expression HyaE [Betaproteobacteria bacterium]OZB59550.1 MAG: hydrogenase-1 expression HyaE [Thiomonas sp. 13-66-29]SBP87006.1 Hydrogenase expression/formation protein HoxO [Thiomonas delicata]